MKYDVKLQSTRIISIQFVVFYRNKNDYTYLYRYVVQHIMSTSIYLYLLLYYTAA